MKLELTDLILIHRKTKNITWQNIRRKLHSVITQIKRLCKGRCKCRLSNSRNILHQNMTSGKHRRKHLSYNI